VALKVQDVHHECPTNRYERRIYPYLQGGVGMPTLWAAGVQDGWDYLAIDLLGPSLDRLLRQSLMDCMDLRSVCCIGMQVVSPTALFKKFLRFASSLFSKDFNDVPCVLHIVLRTVSFEDLETGVHAFEGNIASGYSVGKLYCGTARLCVRIFPSAFRLTKS
jgi:hypothetical protein